jgi:hypothetical protein
MQGGARLNRGARLNPEYPDSNDGPEYGQAGNRPTRYVVSAICFRLVYHRIVPMGHDSLLEIASGR